MGVGSPHVVLHIKLHKLVALCRHHCRCQLRQADHRLALEAQQLHVVALQGRVGRVVAACAGGFLMERVMSGTLGVSHRRLGLAAAHVWHAGRASAAGSHVLPMGRPACLYAGELFVAGGGIAAEHPVGHHHLRDRPGTALWQAIW